MGLLRAELGCDRGCAAVQRLAGFFPGFCDLRCDFVTTHGQVLDQKRTGPIDQFADLAGAGRQRVVQRAAPVVERASNHFAGASDFADDVATAL